MDTKYDMDLANAELLDAEVKLIEAKAKAWDALKNTLNSYGLSIDDVINQGKENWLGVNQFSKNNVVIEETCDREKVDKDIKSVRKIRRRTRHGVKYLIRHIEKIRKDYAYYNRKELAKKYGTSVCTLSKALTKCNISKSDCVRDYFSTHDVAERDQNIINIVKEEEEQKNNNLGQLQIFA